MRALQINLQQRIAGTLLSFSLVIGTIVGVLGYLLNEHIEAVIWERTLESELTFFLHRQSFGMEVVQPPDYPLKVYAQRVGATDDSVPSEFQDLNQGLHDELAIGDRLFCVLVRDISSSRYYVSFDITELEHDERLLAGAGSVAIILILSMLCLLSIQLARWLVRPIHSLAEQLSNLEPNSIEAKLAPQYSDAEVKVIAAAIDGFLARLRSFIQREQEFVSFASHELRTPISVISGACDVLTSNTLPADIERPIARIARTTRTMGQTVTALLFLAKEQGNSLDAREYCDVHRILPRLVEDHRFLLTDKALTVTQQEYAPTTITAPEGMAAIVLSNLIRNAFQHTKTGQISLSLSDGVFTIVDTGPGIMPAQLKETLSYDVGKNRRKGFGLYLARRISERLDWRLEIVSTPAIGTTAKLDFGKTVCSEADLLSGDIASVSAGGSDFRGI